ncbi:MAG: extracellular solute-binding protein [Thermoleophilia bacterium]|nr:extracellular solute-binding protein [Thermoleophilia bacterium]MDH3725737.1 extracellular solute-binding protein [Thermoleophilia bacterium]
MSKGSLTWRPRLAAALPIVVVIGIVGAACSSADDENSITVYSGRSEELVAPLIERFEEQSEVQLDVRYGETADLALLIDEEGDNSPADVFFAQSPGAVAFLAGKERLGRLDETTVASIDQRFVDPDRRWTGVSGRQRVLVYNTDEVSEADLPSVVGEVIEGDLQGKVAVAPTNGSFQDFVTAFRTIEGEDPASAWLDALGDDGPPTYAKNSAIVDAVARGEVTMGLVNHYYALRALAEDPDLPVANHRFSAGDVGSLVIPATVSVLADAEDSAAAKEFVDFLLGEEAQQYFAEETFEYPLREGVAASDQLPPLSELQPPSYEFGTLADLRTTARLISESGLE